MAECQGLPENLQREALMKNIPEDIKDLPYFYPTFNDSREATKYLEKRARDAGYFLLRLSSKGNEFLAITVSIKRQSVRHVTVIIERTPTLKYYITKQAKFDIFEDLRAYYSQHGISNSERIEDVKLLVPLTRGYRDIEEYEKLNPNLKYAEGVPIPMCTGGESYSNTPPFLHLNADWSLFDDASHEARIVELRRKRANSYANRPLPRPPNDDNLGPRNRQRESLRRSNTTGQEYGGGARMVQKRGSSDMKPLNRNRNSQNVIKKSTTTRPQTVHNEVLEKEDESSQQEAAKGAKSKLMRPLSLFKKCGARPKSVQIQSAALSSKTEDAGQARVSPQAEATLPSSPEDTDVAVSRSTEKMDNEDVEVSDAKETARKSNCQEDGELRENKTYENQDKPSNQPETQNDKENAPPNQVEEAVGAIGGRDAEPEIKGQECQVKPKDRALACSQKRRPSTAFIDDYTRPKTSAKNFRSRPPCPTPIKSEKHETYYSRPVDENENRIDDLRRALQEYEFCDCGVPMSDSVLPRNWTVHRSLHAETYKWLFYQDESGETTWDLPEDIVHEMTPHQRNVIFKLSLESGKFPPEVLNMGVAEGEENGSGKETRRGSSPRLTKNGTADLKTLKTLKKTSRRSFNVLKGLRISVK